MEAAENYVPQIRKPGFVREILDHLSRWDYWKGMLKSMVQMAVQTALEAGLLAFGSTLVWYVREKKGKSNLDMVGSHPGASPMATAAFGRDQFSPTPGYRPSYPIAPVPSSPAGPDRFPGF